MQVNPSLDQTPGYTHVKMIVVEATEFLGILVHGIIEASL